MRITLTQPDQSIVVKAFRRELVPEDHRDEAASELLENPHHPRSHRCHQKEESHPETKGKSQ